MSNSPASLRLRPAPATAPGISPHPRTERWRSPWWGGDSLTGQRPQVWNHPGPRRIPGRAPPGACWPEGQGPCRYLFSTQAWDLGAWKVTGQQRHGEGQGPGGGLGNENLPSFPCSYAYANICTWSKLLLL